MKILRIHVEGLPLYKEDIDLSFYAAQRVQDSHKNEVSHLFSNIYVNNAEAFAGINASGKTSALNIIDFSFKLLQAQPLNNCNAPKILGIGNKAIFDIYFFADGQVYYLHSEIIREQEADGSRKTRILSESLWRKSATTKINKTNLFDFDGLEAVRERDDSSEYLSDDVSIMVAVNKQLEDVLLYNNLSKLTNYNIMVLSSGNVATEIVSVLDPTIEYITAEEVDNNIRIKLKFYGRDEIRLNTIHDIDTYLSSGTIKGIGVFTSATYVLMLGGYLIIDEIENHFNHELVMSLLRLFLNKRTNPRGAVIIFSTHYPELLDELERNDAVFITKNDMGLKIENLGNKLTRNDMKKSEVYESNRLKGTAPKYSSLSALQKSIMNKMEAYYENK